MKQLGLPLGFMNTSALHVNEDGTFKLSQDNLPLNSNGSTDLPDTRNYSKKRQHKQRGKKKVMTLEVLILLNRRCLFPFQSQNASNIQ